MVWQIARKLLDPVLLVETLNFLLKCDGNRDLMGEFKQAFDNLLLGVTDVTLRRSFIARIAALGEHQKGPALPRVF